MYAKHKNKDFIKLTIRCDSDELHNFKKICEISGLSANNQINILMRQYIHNNKFLLESSSHSIPELDELWGNPNK